MAKEAKEAENARWRKVLKQKDINKVLKQKDINKVLKQNVKKQSAKTRLMQSEGLMRMMMKSSKKFLRKVLKQKD